ncbi:3D domain-containing protein [Desulfosporosinus nitroreducens]|uniref:3D domain-containing protein n=1 Tax=Desulfosporosinus nitroreducens TaxID=2018668 RepID=A0ABT8QTL0_9FIRM|nr:3D domain-containing protein [Desulfosporosinus nitroreducens]MDO0823965.1 3D domain-containing protein [Desulfosporosinus nitroreducens]
MYSLPITTYSDYWRKTKLWSAYFGSLAVLVAGTRYSSLNDQDVGRTIKPSLQLVNSLSIDSVRKDELIEGAPVRKVSSEGLAVQGLTNKGQISRGIGSSTQDYQEALSPEVETRVTSKIEIIDKELPFDTQYVESDKLPPGESQIQVKGEKGTRREVVKTFKVGGQPVDQQVQSFFELKAPKKEVIIRNTQPIPKKKVIIQNSSPGSAKVDVDLTKLNISKTLTVEATAYTYTGNNTATGVKPREGLIAVDPKVIAMGSQVYVEGYGYAIAADTGGSIRGNRIDVFFSTFRQCIDWGRKPVKIHILSTI